MIATKFGADARGLNGPDWGGADPAGTCGALSRARCAGSAPTTSTSSRCTSPDPVTPIEETLAALHELVEEGKVRYLGSSNFTSWQVVDADWTARTAGTAPFVSAQNRYNLLDRSAEAELVPALEHVGRRTDPYVPLASGLLTGKYRRGQDAPAGTRLTRVPERLAQADFDRIEALEKLASAWEIDLPTLALGALAAQPAVATVIAGARTPDQLRANVASIAWEPTLEQLAAIDEVAPGPAV